VGLATDTRLVGWPWTAGSFGWVEPTARALIALRAAGRDDPRLAEATRFLLDRRCEEGGWNYGAVRVLDAPIPPYPHTTALAAIALAGRVPAAALARDLDVLTAFLPEPLGVFDLAWIALALDACGRDGRSMLARLPEAVDASPWEENVHALALALLATRLATGTNPFRLSPC
jgi:hypothetical protein